MSKGQTLQDPFLNSLRKERIPVSIFFGQRHQAARPNRVFRSICGVAEKHRQPNGV